MPLSNVPERSLLGVPYRTPLGALGRYPYDYECYKHGMVFFPIKDWASFGLTTADWNTMVATYKQYNKNGSHFTIACQDFDYSDLYPADGDSLPSKDITFLNVGAAPRSDAIDTGDCGGCATWVCWNGTCYTPFAPGDPYAPVIPHDLYWVMDARAEWATYQTYIKDAIGRCSTPFEKNFYIITSSTGNTALNRYNFFKQLYRYFNWVEGGSGWNGAGWPYSGTWSYGWYTDAFPEAQFLQAINATLAASRIL